MPEKLLTPEQAAEILAVRAKTVLAWLRQGKLKGVRVGRLWRVKPSDLDAFINTPLPEEPGDGPDGSGSA